MATTPPTIPEFCYNPNAVILILFLMGEGDWHPCGNFFIIHFQIFSLLGANQLQDTDLSDEEGGYKDEIVTNQSTPRVGNLLFSNRMGLLGISKGLLDGLLD